MMMYPQEMKYISANPAKQDRMRNMRHRMPYGIRTGIVFLKNE